MAKTRFKKTNYGQREGQGVKKFDFLILCLWSTLVEADLMEPKLAAREIALTQKMRFTFFTLKYNVKAKYKNLRFIESN